MFEFFYWPDGYWCDANCQTVPNDFECEAHGEFWRAGKIAGSKATDDDIELWIHNKLQAIRAAEKRRKYGQTS
jgi:hypothetical protein